MCVCVKTAAVTHAQAENRASNEITSVNETNLCRPHGTRALSRIVRIQQLSEFLKQIGMIPPYANIERPKQTVHELLTYID